MLFFIKPPPAAAACNECQSIFFRAINKLRFEILQTIVIMN